MQREGQAGYLDTTYINHISASFLKQSFQKIPHVLKEIEIFMAIRSLHAMDNLLSFLPIAAVRTLTWG